MQRYKDTDNDSGVMFYEIGENYIKVEFKDHTLYTYTYDSAGEEHIEKMKELAEVGDGLNAYININKVPFASKK